MKYYLFCSRGSKTGTIVIAGVPVLHVLLGHNRPRQTLEKELLHELHNTAFQIQNRFAVSEGDAEIVTTLTGGTVLLRISFDK